MFKQVNPIIDYSVCGLCCRPYPGHKTGCPNFNHKQGCPPQAQLFDKVFDLTKPVFAIYNAFDFKSHVERMKAANPTWTQQQLTCCLYWQNTARKQLTKELAYFMITHYDYYVAVAFYKGLDKDLGPLFKRIIISPPEAMGVEVTKTMLSIGFMLEWPPANVAYQIALAGKLVSEG